MSILIKNVLLNGRKKDIYIGENTIEQINDTINLEAEFRIDGKHKAAVPSLINAHTHAAMTLLQGYADDMHLSEWLENKIWPTEAKLTEDDVYRGAKLACLGMIKTGTTFFNDMYWHYHGTAKAVDESGIRSAVSAVFIDLFDEAKAKEQIKLNEKLFKETKKYSERVTFALGPHAVYTVSEESLIWAKEFADKHSLILHIHLSETKKEVDDCIKKHKKRPVEYLEDIGFLGSNVFAAHSIWLNDKEIELMKKYDVKPVRCPTSNMKLASGALPYLKMKKAGLTVTLGTDGCASNNNLDMLEEMKFAALLEKFHCNDSMAMPAKEAFELATVNGAKAFNLNCGEIKEGKLADLLLVNLKNINLNPRHNLISNLVYAAHGDCVDTTICNGKILMENGKVDGEEEIIEKANEVAMDLIER
jgi:5-methylthioadenosine/S-adenosylhomocysteine deaminase